MLNRYVILVAQTVMLSVGAVKRVQDGAVLKDRLVDCASQVTRLTEGLAGAVRETQAEGKGRGQAMDVRGGRRREGRIDFEQSGHLAHFRSWSVDVYMGCFQRCQ